MKEQRQRADEVQLKLFTTLESCSWSASDSAWKWNSVQHFEIAF